MYLAGESNAWLIIVGQGVGSRFQGKQTAQSSEVDTIVLF